VFKETNNNVGVLIMGKVNGIITSIPMSTVKEALRKRNWDTVDLYLITTGQSQYGEELLMSDKLTVVDNNGRIKLLSFEEVLTILKDDDSYEGL
jgi:hypothetical protein